jgi:two-component system, NarL family, sensor kinase
MRLVRSPVAQFLVIGLLTFLAILWMTRVLSARAAEAEAVEEARALTELLAHSVAEPELTTGLVRGNAGAIDRFDRAVLVQLLARDVRRIKIWNAEGRVVYSNETEQIGQVFELEADQLAVLREGGTSADVSELDRPENELDQTDAGLVEVYTRITAPGQEPLLFEAYYAADRLKARTSEIFEVFSRITALGLLLLLAIATPLLWVTNRRLTRVAAEREKLLLSAVRASEAERRRIARDLHDGVVQDLAGTAFAISGVARSATTSPVSKRVLNDATKSLRDGLRALRSLLVEIHPPGLDAESLPSALEDLIAPAANQGVAASVVVQNMGPASDAVVALTWRVAQEAVRNALRHANATSVTVSVECADNIVTLRVVDDGIGMPVAEPQDGRVRFGLQGLSTLVEEAGGTLLVEQPRSGGTAVVLRIAP